MNHPETLGTKYANNSFLLLSSRHPYVYVTSKFNLIYQESATLDYQEKQEMLGQRFIIFVLVQFYSKIC